MEKKKIITASAAALILLCLPAFAQNQNKDIKQQSKELSDVKKTIKQKQLEKDRLALREKTFKRELSWLNSEIAKTEKKLAGLSLDIKNAEKNLALASSKYNKAYEKQTDWNNAMLDEMYHYNMMTFLVPYEDDPTEYKIRQAALRYKKDNFDKEARAADSSSEEIKKWESAKKKLLALRAEENATANERKNLIKEKNNLLKSTVNSRAAAEKEIKSLNESAKALQSLIDKLTAEAQKKKREESAARAPAAPAAQHKKLLPWPVEGKVAVKFGKSKHPEFSDTYIISNGIKIDAPDFAQVKSVDAGTVIFAGEFRSYGKVVIIEHKDSYFTVYGHLDQILVKENHKVSRGTVLAKLGKGEDSILYFEVRHDNNPDNPLLWLEKK